jgi:hypothetical protein
MHLLLALLGTQYLDVCELPALGVTLRTHQGDGLCGASVSYLSPTSDASYSAVTLPGGSWSLDGAEHISAVEFIIAGLLFEDGVYIADDAVLSFELGGSLPREIEIDHITCTCTIR